MSVTSVLIVVAAVVWIMGRRLAGQLLQVRGLFVLPVVLCAVGIGDLSHLHPLDATTVAFIAAGVAISVVLGLARGTTVHLGERGGELWMRYRPLTVVLWFVNIAAKLVAVPVERGVSHASAGAAGHALALSIGAGVLAESAVVLLRALPRGTRLVWRSGKDGAPHATSERLDRLQQAVRSGTPLIRRDW